MKRFDLIIAIIFTGAIVLFYSSVCMKYSGILMQKSNEYGLESISRNLDAIILGNDVFERQADSLWRISEDYKKQSNYWQKRAFLGF